MAAIAPCDFFVWKRSRSLIDIRSAVKFEHGSLEGVQSLPADTFDTLVALGQYLRNTVFESPVHLIDSDGCIAPLLDRYISSDYLEGGYRRFRAWRECTFETGPAIHLLGGYTGSGKTIILQHLKNRGFQVIDLESLALHKGSVFGGLPLISQPRCEIFQNRLLDQWISLDSQVPVLIEEKGPFLGSVGLPTALYRKVKKAPMLHLDVPFEKRLNNIKKEYGSLDPDRFRTALRKLEARMGMSQNHKALHYHDTGQQTKCFELLLNYYDSAYERRRRTYLSGQCVNLPLYTDSNYSAIDAVESCLSHCK